LCEEGQVTVDTTDVTRLARVAQALSDPIRLKMLGMLSEGRECCSLPDVCTRNVPGDGLPSGICVCEFQEQFGLSQSRTSYHMRVLKDAGLVTEETRGKWTFYQLDREALAEVLQAMQDLGRLARE
jgi:ArsR family transcriptional regulator, arsenate/arsenite/antimonite-responsive transcriptional repressor